MCFFRWLYRLFFGPPAQTVGYGFRWVAGTPFNAVAFVTVTDQSPAGLYVLFSQQVIDSPNQFFENAGMQLGIIFPLPAASSAAFTLAMQGVMDGGGNPVTADNNLMLRLEGFLQYTHYCLTYINATPAGNQLLTALNAAARTTYIIPSAIHNQTAGMSMCFVSRMVLTLNMNIAANQRAQLIQILQTASGAVGLPAFQWLAQQINQMPLYSMFEQSNAYPPAFLNNNGVPVAAGDLQQWFNTGSNCNLVINLTAAPAIANVPLLNFVKNAVIILLYANSPAGGGSNNTVNFDVRDWANNNVGEDPIINTMADRPPAIGLAHELIHAYHNARGDQSGADFGSFSTTLFELLCVGMSPWAAYPVTENAIRGAWPPVGVWPPAGDALNNRAAAQRTVYVAPGPGQMPQDLRNGNGPI